MVRTPLLVTAVSISLGMAGCSAGPDAPEREPDAATAVPDARVEEEAPPLVLSKARTERVGALVGTSRTPFAPVGLIGTDLGVSFERDGKLVFLFGDSWTTPDLRAHWDADSAAWTLPALPRDGGPPPLSFYTGAGGRFLGLTLPVDLAAMNVPVDAAAVGDTTYVFFSTGWSPRTERHTASVLARMDGLRFDRLSLVSITPSDKFINVAVVRDGEHFFIFGSGVYRKSAVFLARVPVDELADRASWEYFTGSRFAHGEGGAAAVVPGSCVGELSVRRHPTLGLWLLAYNCGAPRGIVLHTAPAPTGPWSEGIVIFDPAPDADRGYGTFMHQHPDVVGHDDGLSEPGREEEWGGEYGPYLIPSFFHEDAPGVHHIYYTLSSWNPYTVHLMRTVLVEPGVTAPPPPPRGVGLPPTRLENGDFATGTFEGWQSSGDPFVLFMGADGKRRLTTYVSPRGDAVMGKLWQDFTVDATTRELQFAVHGGHARVKLYRGTDLVRMTRGRRTNDVETQVRWRLEEYRGETLRLVVEDDASDPWGFIGTTGFSFR